MLCKGLFLVLQLFVFAVTSALLVAQCTFMICSLIISSSNVEDSTPLQRPVYPLLLWHCHGKQQYNLLNGHHLKHMHVFSDLNWNTISNYIIIALQNCNICFWFSKCYSWLFQTRSRCTVREVSSHTAVLRQQISHVTCVENQCHQFSWWLRTHGGHDF